jgi:hypothetical protein
MRVPELEKNRRCDSGYLNGVQPPFMTRSSQDIQRVLSNIVADVRACKHIS